MRCFGLLNRRERRYRGRSIVPTAGTIESAKIARQSRPRTMSDDASMLDVYFLAEEILDAEESKPGPEFSSGAGYRVAVTSAADGSATSCPD